MKPVSFTYARPGSLAEACALLAADPEARPIAGGQTLVPMLAMRLARPTQLVDIARIPALHGITERDGMVEIGAATRQAEAEHDPLVARAVPLLTAALPWVGHPPTRARGTIGGSLANADPAAEIGLVAVALGARIVLAGPDGEREMPAGAFFLGPMTTALPAGWLIRAVRFPMRPAGRVGVGFDEINARASDFAFAAAAAQLRLDAAGSIVELAVAIGGATETPILLDLSALLGLPPDPAAFISVLAAAIAPLRMMRDPHATERYRRRVATTLAGRAIAAALLQAGGEDAGHA